MEKGIKVSEMKGLQDTCEIKRRDRNVKIRNVCR